MKHYSIAKSIDCSHVSEDDSSSFQRSMKIEQTEWLTTEEAATYLRLPIGSLRNMTSNGKVPYHKLGKLNRYRRSELEQLMASNKRGVRYEY